MKARRGRQISGPGDKCTCELLIWALWKSSQCFYHRDISPVPFIFLSKTKLEFFYKLLNTDLSINIKGVRELEGQYATKMQMQAAEERELSSFPSSPPPPPFSGCFDTV